MSFLYLIIAAGLPVFIRLVDSRNTASNGCLLENSTTERYKTLWSGVDTRRPAARRYTLYFVVRRLITALILVRLHKYAFFQITLLMALSMTQLAYLLGTRPLADRSGSHLEVMNELCIATCCLLLTNFLNVAAPDSL